MPFKSGLPDPVFLASLVYAIPEDNPQPTVGEDDGSGETTT